MQGKGIYIVFIGVVLVIGLGYIYFYNHLEQADNETITYDSEDNNEEAAVEAGNTIYVQVCGAVKNEGVYETEEGTRVFEVVELAGGLTEDAAINVVNQARLAKDGEMIYFPTEDEVLTGGYTNGTSQLININLATKEQLMTLPGIGESKASSIIKYRENEGPFNTIEDIMNVDGIKEGLFNSIQSQITI